MSKQSTLHAILRGINVTDETNMSLVRLHLRKILSFYNLEYNFYENYRN